ncbi:calpain-8-like [Anomaloglossus baeobatrachus]|uniref:calpain-8-like n=1 Tax=Anomaloglossus baeobatrachus TaxID=238106 RepID=UPI003F4F6D54
MSGVAAQIAQDRAKAAGLGSTKNPVKFADQDFEKLKAECLASKTLFEDPEFPAAPSSMGTNKLGPDSKKAEGLEWKRPKDIKKNPVFIVGGAEREDINQGGLGNCWLLGSIACLTTNKDCLSRVIPADQSFEKDYAGIFHFKFWQYGEWVDVVVDDRLPTKSNKLMFVKSKTSNEFWSALLEKAYAKINGSYEGLVAGFVLESLADFTGGVGELYTTKSAPDNLFGIIQKTLGEKSLVGCTSFPEAKEEGLSTSIVRGHIYAITGAKEVTFGKNNVNLIRVWNPWGHKEWTGAWSDNSDTWNTVDPKIKEELNVKKDEGEFWMAFPDFLKEYQRVEICHLTMSEICCGDDFKWSLTEFSGSWKVGSSSGGNKSLKTFCINPQYRITLEAPDGDNSKECTMIVSLQQKDRRKIKHECAAFLFLAVYVYKVSPSDKIPLGKAFFKDNDYVGFSDFDCMREMSKRFELLPGDYIIVPAIFNATQEADYYLRVFTEKPTKAEETEGDLRIAVCPPMPQTDSVFEIVKDELQKGEFNETEVKDMLDKMFSLNYPDLQPVGLSIKTVRDLIKLMDEDNTKTLSTDEFKKTWLKVEKYWNIFQSADADKSGTLSAADLRDAIMQAGFNFNTTILNAVIQKLAHDDLEMDCNVFFSTIANLETLFNMFDLLKPNEGGSISLSLDEWLLTKLA